MKLDLALMNLQKADLELPAAGGDAHRPQGVRVRSADGLSGTLTRDARALRLSNVRADPVELDSMVLWFGSVLVEASQPSTLTRLSTSYTHTAEGTDLDLALGTLESDRLRIAVGTVSVAARTQLSAPELRVRPGAGSVEAKEVVLEEFALTLGGVTFAAPTLNAETLRVAWGEGGFELTATNVTTPMLEVTAPGTTAQCRLVQAATIHLRGGEVQLEDLSASDASVDLDLVRAPVDPEAAVARTDASTDTPALLAWDVLDGLSGHLHVDVFVDVRLPVIQRRRATHELRVPIQAGTIDFRELERDLATLEESLLDFSVRDDALVLELGLPLLPTRGRGKPLIRWPLKQSDLALANERRVRLAVLPSAEVASKQDERNGARRSSRPPESSRKSVALNEFALQNVQSKLSLKGDARQADAVIRHIAWEDLRLGGFLAYRPEADPGPAGALKVQVEGIELTAEGFSVGEKRLDLFGMRIGRVYELAAHFAGLRPNRLHAKLGPIALERVRHRAPG